MLPAEGEYSIINGPPELKFNRGNVLYVLEAAVTAYGYSKDDLFWKHELLYWNSFLTSGLPSGILTHAPYSLMWKMFSSQGFGHQWERDPLHPAPLIIRHMDFHVSFIQMELLYLCRRKCCFQAFPTFFGIKVILTNHNAFTGAPLKMCV